MTAVILGPRVRPHHHAGGKAKALAAVIGTGLKVPHWFVVLPPDEAEGSPADRLPRAVQSTISRNLKRIAPAGARFAVRSSARLEDGDARSFAGQYDTVLDVEAKDVVAAIERVRRSAGNARVVAYAGAENSKLGVPAVIVQRMLAPSAAGVAFSADPVTGKREVAVVSAVRGLGERLVSGEADADTWRIAEDGSVVDHGGEAAPAISETEAQAVANLARRCSEHFGAPQDIEWAIEDGILWLLQSRPITTLPQTGLWDNSNIAESYAGVTTPLTFSFARQAYTAVYHEMCRLMRVSPARLEREQRSFETLIGLVQGRIYYNLVSWYRILALMPGFRFNREFMEQMMGVRDTLPPEILRQVRPPPPATIAERVRQTRTLLVMVGKHFSVNRSIPAFHRRVAREMAHPLPGPNADLRQLAAEYRRLEEGLLRHWEAPLVNDFLAMIFFGVLRRLCKQWAEDHDGTLQNGLLCGEGDMISAEPARLIREMAALLADSHPQLSPAVRDGSPAAWDRLLASHPRLNDLYEAYLAKFGDRCMQELKLESPSLREEPRSLRLAIVANTAVAARPTGPIAHNLRMNAERRVRKAFWRPSKRALFRWVLRNARARVRDRENLRFERTLVFGRVRSLVLAMGERLAEQGALAQPRDVFYLELEELLDAAEGGVPESGFKARVAKRNRQWRAYAKLPPPPDRFVGSPEAPLAGSTQSNSHADGPTVDPSDPSVRKGMGCCPGLVRGKVHIVLDPRGAHVPPGHILVARHTDPGWILLFPSAAGVLVERGNLLSHAAIVSREMGIPSVVSVPGVTEWLQEGELIEMDGTTGIVRRLAAPSQGVRSAAAGGPRQSVKSSKTAQRSAPR